MTMPHGRRWRESESRWIEINARNQTTDPLFPWDLSLLVCGKRVRVYEWLPDPVLCAGCKRDIMKQEEAAQGPTIETERPKVKLTTGGAP